MYSTIVKTKQKLKPKCKIMPYKHKQNKKQNKVKQKHPVGLKESAWKLL